jgi:hypothetical protein
MSVLSTPIDTRIVEQAAEAGYHAAMTFAKDGVIYEQWANLPEYWKQIYRAQARAIAGVLS